MRLVSFGGNQKSGPLSLKPKTVKAVRGFKTTPVSVLKIISVIIDDYESFNLDGFFMDHDRISNLIEKYCPSIKNSYDSKTLIDSQMYYFEVFESN